MTHLKPNAVLTSTALILGYCALTACASSPKYRFVSDQRDITVTLGDDNDPDYHLRCTVPCTLSVDLERALYAEFEKPGHQSRREDDLEAAFNPTYFNQMLKAIGEQPKSASRPKIKYQVTLLHLETLYANGYPRPETETVQAQRAVGRDEARKNSQAATCAALGLDGADKKARALRRGPPTVTNAIYNMNRSGHCLVRLNATPDGYPTDIEAYFCTHPVFKEPLLSSVHEWVYPPKPDAADDVRTPYCGIESKITVRILNPLGQLLPEHSIEEKQ